MNMNNVKFNCEFFTTRKMYKHYVIENETDIEKAKIVGKGSFEIKTPNFDYELLLDKIYLLNEELDFVNNPYVSKFETIQNDIDKRKKTNKLLIEFIKKYGISNMDDGVNISELIFRIYMTQKIYDSIEDKKDIAFKSDILHYTSKQKEYFSTCLHNLSIKIYENTKKYPVEPYLFYNEKRKKIEIKFISKSVISILNYYLLFKSADNDIHYNTCIYCGNIFESKNHQTKICSSIECKKERKRIYQKNYRRKKQKNK